MIDFHSHILPGIDDGSRSADESIAMLNLQISQGVTRVVATPHFLANKESVEAFLLRREASYKTLQQHENFPKNIQLHLGAEVSYYEGISKLKNLPSLCFTNSNLLLIEMPISKWSNYMIHEVMDLACLPGTQIVLAHVERYRSLQSNDVWQQLLHNDILMQVNANYFLRLATRRKGLSQLLHNQIHFLGSDCHDLKIRPPKIGEAYKYIEHKLGNPFLNSMVEFGHSFFNHPVE